MDEEALKTPDDPRAIAHDARRARRETLLVALIAAMLVGAGVFAVWFATTEAVRYNFRTYMLSLAQVAAVQIDPALHDSLRQPSQLNGPDYLRASGPLRRMREAAPDIRYLYTAVRDGDQARFVLDATPPGDGNGDGVEDQAGLWEIAAIEPQALDKIFGDGEQPGQQVADNQAYTDKWGTVLTAWAPLIDGSGRQFGAVGLDIDAEIFLERLAAARRWALLGLLPAGLLIVIFALGFHQYRCNVLANARAAEAAAHRDKLTGLANRDLFTQRLQEAVERARRDPRTRFAVFFLDFDRFKVVNDSMGHAAGDELLRRISQRLTQALRQHNGLIARFGGDEFLVLLEDLGDATEVREIAAQLHAALSAGYSIHGRDLHSTASIGIVTSEQGLESSDAIVRNADMAMYEAKRAGRACSVVFSEDMYAQLTRRVDIESGLRQALGTSQISVAYQPIIELTTGRITSVEALVRWRHPVLGQLPPDEFIPLAEESGLIVPLGELVLNESCAMLARWQRFRPETAPELISVNISRAELALGEQLLATVRKALHDSGLPATCLQLEVTEREVMRHPQASLTLMHQLRAMGVRLAMDDFGTGTSSLSCLRDYPFDVIKIDRSFVSGLAAGPDMLPLIHATIALAENLGKRSVAEGVETAAQVAILQSMGCHYAQGYYFCHPLPAEQLLARRADAPFAGQEAVLAV
jgi:diguanylate cyclase (GGDEF)-like protein